VRATVDALVAQSPVGAAAADPDLAAHLPWGRLVGFPIDPEHLDRLCRLVLPLFETGRDYAEPAVNGLLLRVTDDYPGLRRALVDRGYLQRPPDGSRYRLVGPEAPSAPPDR
jgi:hypothetical protein